MVGQHLRLNEHELGQTPGGSEGQGGLVCCSPWGHKELDMTQQLNNNNMMKFTCLAIEDSHVDESTWKQFLKLQSSLQTTAAQVNILNGPHEKS